jgi:phospholipid-translocating ATPase
MVFCVILLLVLTTGCLIGTTFYDKIYNTHWYLFDREPTNFKSQKSLYYFITFMFYLNLNYIIPLALYITLELARFLGSKFFEWDLEMYDEERNLPARANTSDLNENLGQVEYLFSDKTGTLTENEMVFKHFGLDGKIYEEQNGNIFEVGNGEEPKQLEVKIDVFFCFGL